MAIIAGVNLEEDSNDNVSNIVEDNLVLYLDAGRKYSYGYTGQYYVWKDLSSSGNDVTFYNAGGTTYSTVAPGAPTFSENNGGQFTFDGTNDWGKLTSNIYLSTNCTVSTWIKYTSTSEMGIFSNCSGGPVNIVYGLNAGKIYYQHYYAAWYGTVSNNTYNDGKWHNVVWVKSGGTSLDIYVDNTLDGNFSINPTNGNLNSICTKWGPCNSISYGADTDSYGTVFNGTMAILMVYTDELTTTEITYNYNKLKDRFRY